MDSKMRDKMVFTWVLERGKDHMVHGFSKELQIKPRLRLMRSMAMINQDFDGELNQMENGFS